MRPRWRTHLGKPDSRGTVWPACGVFGVGIVLADDPTKVDCGHCIRIRDKSPAPQKFSGRARWRAMKALAERHPEEYAQLLDEATRHELVNA